MTKRIRQTYVGNSICHICKEDISIDTAVRSLIWAFGMPGVRWLLCSVKCAELQREEVLG